MAGYSGAPLWKKLGIKPGTRLCVQNAPQGYSAWIAPLLQGALIVSANKGGCDIVHLFVHSLSLFDRELQQARRLIDSSGAIWVSWPRKSSGIVTDVDENRIRSIALKTDLVDVKVCAVSEVWSGLKLVVRAHLR